MTANDSAAPTIDADVAHRDTGELYALDRLRREIREAGRLVGQDEARFLVTLYYDLQEHRIALDGQERSLVASEKPADVVHHFATQMSTLEKQMVSVLDPFTMASEVGRWSRAQVGVGPILAAGFLAHIDIERAATVGQIWRFAGLDPTVRWEKGQKRPWNAQLKVICWRLGDSFVKVSGKEHAFYGRIYKERKLLEVQRNEQGLFADQAAETLRVRKIQDPATRKVYEAGHLPPGRLDLRARRYAVKLFLAAWHEVAFVDRYGTLPVKPYVLEHLPGHVHEVVPPDLPDAVKQLRRADGRPC